MLKVLTEKQLAHALFFSVKHNDFENAYSLLKMGAPVQTAFYLTQDNMVYTSNFFVGKAAQTIKKYGHSHAKSKFVIELLDLFIEAKADLRCHCSPKNNHYCALSEALKHITLNTEDDIFLDGNLLILKLLYQGATLKNNRNQKDYKWVGIDTLLAYISTQRQEASQLLAGNRHRKCVAGRNTITSK